MRRLLALALILAACAPRGALTVDPRAGEVGQVQQVFVGTTRLVDTEANVFGAGRLRDDTTFARYDVSVPPLRTLGEINWPKPREVPDPRRHFLTTGAIVFDGSPDFRRDLAHALAQEKRGQREATIFVHGFNNTFAEGLYRIAQLSSDLDLPGVTVHYAWPSLGKPLGYVYDRDSALFARDGLEQLMAEVQAAGAERTLIVAHSMGASLAMEALRQTAIRGNRRVMDRIAGVLLIAPDIDVDVFHAQARGVGRLPQPFVIFSSTRDRALQLSARLTGQRDRLGNLSDLSEVADLEVTVVDVAAFNVGGGHFNVANSPALIQILGRINDINAAFDRDRTGRTGLLPGVVLTVQNATKIILSPVAGIADGLAQ
jgi:esterase/lipase superfamily enzyme